MPRVPVVLAHLLLVSGLLLTAVRFADTRSTVAADPVEGGRGSAYTLVSANLEFGAGDPDEVAGLVAELRGQRLPVVGDLNATTGHAALREVFDAWIRDAAEQAGSGWSPTWPTPYRRPWLRPVLGLDHVLVGDGTSATATRTVAITDTDHRALVVPLSPRATGAPA